MAAEERTFHLGNQTLQVPRQLHIVNRQRLVDELVKVNKDCGATYVLLQGGEVQTQYCSDTEVSFRQESYFHWVSS